MKKVLALMASPRKGKNTDFLLDTFLKGIEESGEEVVINKVYLSELRVNYCDGCSFCSNNGKCRYDDGMTKLYEEFDTSDGIVFASPIYFFGISAMGKNVIDRCQVYWSSKYILKDSYIDRGKKRIGAFLASSGAPKKHTSFVGAQDVASVFFRSINTDFKESILIANTDKIKTWEDKDLIDETYNKGKSFFEKF